MSGRTRAAAGGAVAVAVIVVAGLVAVATGRRGPDPAGPEAAEGRADGEAAPSADAPGAVDAASTEPAPSPAEAARLRASLLPALRDGQLAPELRERAAVDLGRLARSDAETARALGALLLAEDEEVAAFAGLALSGAGRPGATVLGELLEASATDAVGRARAVDVLRELGAEAAPAVAALAALLGAPGFDDDAGLRSGAAWTLAGIGAEAAPAVEALARALREGDATTRHGAAEALGAIGAPAIPALVAALAVDDADVAALAAGTLGRVAGPFPETVAPLVGLLGHDDARVRRAAVSALEARGEAAVAALRSALRSEAPRVRGGAAHALGELGAAAAPALADLFDASRPPARVGADADQVITAHLAAEGALERLGAVSVPELVRRLAPAAEAAADRRALAARLLGAIEGAGGEAGVAALIAALDDPSVDVRENAAGALGEQAADPARAVPALARALERGVAGGRVAGGLAFESVIAASDGSAEVVGYRAAVAEAMAAYRADAVASLERLLGHGDAEAATAAALALGEIGPPAAPARDALRAAADGPRPGVAAAAADALARIFRRRAD